MLSPAIIVKDLNARQFGKTVLEDISFELKAGEHLAIIGESGSGKSSLVKAIAGKLFATGLIDIRYTGTSNLNQKSVLIEHTEAFKNLSNVSDFYYQQRYNSCDAEDALTIEQELAKLEEGNKETIALLNRLNLTHRLHTPLIQLSNGEQKKLQLVKAMVQRPQVLILDKVFTGLDVASRRQLHHLIDETANNGTTIILVTDERELPSCITHIGELYKGRLVQFSSRENFVAKHPENADHLKQPELTAALFNQSTVKFKNVVKMDNVTIRYGEKTVLYNINWNVKQGERWWVKGHNGAGKSTLLSLITADNPQAYSQEIFLFDKKRGTGESIWDIKKNIGFVSPELHRYFDFTATVHHVIASGFFDTMGLFKRLNESQEELVSSWIRFFELEQEKDKPLYLLAAGQQRRAILARALIKNPVLLVLDEPCQGLDDHQAKDFIDLIDDICRRSETTVIYVSHYENEIPKSITNTLELQQGKQVVLYTKNALTA